MSFPPSEPNLVYLLRGMLIAEISLVLMALPVAAVSNSVTEAAAGELGLNQATLVTPEVDGFACAGLVFLLPAQVVSWVGLFKFWPWARWLYACTTAASHVFFLLLGVVDVSLTWGFSAALDDVGTFLSGMIVGVIFLTPVAHRFQPSAAAATPGNQEAERPSNGPLR